MINYFNKKKNNLLGRIIIRERKQILLLSLTQWKNDLYSSKVDMLIEEENVKEEKLNDNNEVKSLKSQFLDDRFDQKDEITYKMTNSTILKISNQISKIQRRYLQDSLNQIRKTWLNPCKEGIFKWVRKKEEKDEILSSFKSILNNRNRKYTSIFFNKWRENLLSHLTLKANNYFTTCVCDCIKLKNFQTEK